MTDTPSTSSPDPSPSQPKRLIWSRRVTLLSLGGLVLLFTWLNLTRPDGSIMRWLVQCIPLLMFVPGLLQQSYRSYSWLCFVVILYLIPAITQVVMALGFRNAEQPAAHWSDGVILLLAVVLFFAATMSSRWLQYWHLQTQTRNEDEQ